MCVGILVDHVDRIASLRGLPDEMVAFIFMGVLRRQKMTIEIARLFLEIDCEAVKDVIGTFVASGLPRVRAGGREWVISHTPPFPDYGT